jgi:hypothetical protein
MKQNVFVISNTPSIEAPEIKGLRVEYLNLQLLKPDPAQARRILPEDIYERFWSQSTDRLNETGFYAHAGHC